MMGEERLNALLLVYIQHIHQDIFLDYKKIMDMYESKYPKSMLLTNPLNEN